MKNKLKNLKKFVLFLKKRLKKFIMSKDKLVSTKKTYKNGKLLNVIYVYQRPNGTKYEVIA